MSKLVLSCKKETELIDKSFVIPLSRLEKLKLRLHASMCAGCTEYLKQSAMINEYLNRHFTAPDETESVTD